MGQRLEALLKEARWKRQGNAWIGPRGAYVFHEESVPGSWDRTLAPFLAKAILEARARNSPEVESVAVIEVKRATPLASERLEKFVNEVAPDQSWLLLDQEGRSFSFVKNAAELSRVGGSAQRAAASQKAPVSLFTDLHQWLLKVLLAPHLEERLLTAPRGRALRNASALAEAARVSVPVATRFVKALDAFGHLERRFGDLRIARPLELLRIWAAQRSHPARLEQGVVAVRGWEGAVLGYGALLNPERPPFVLSLHEACTELGFGHVRGAMPVLWASSLEPSQLEPFGFVADSSGKMDLVLRTPRFPESLYRGLVRVNGKPVTDVIQCWLDATHYRIRGQEQADYLWRHVFEKSFDE